MLPRIFAMFRVHKNFFIFKVLVLTFNSEQGTMGTKEGGFPIPKCKLFLRRKNDESSKLYEF